MIVKAQNLFPQASQLLSRVSQLIADMLHSLDTEVRDYEMDKLLLKKKWRIIHHAGHSYDNLIH